MTADSTSGSVEFGTFVAGIATTAAATLKQVEDLCGARPGGDPGQGESQDAPHSPPTAADRASRGLGAARQLIDTLVMLEAKTEGNLTADERRLLRDVLMDLRVKYVHTSDMVSGRQASR